MATWVEYRDKHHQKTLGSEVSGALRAADGRRHSRKLDEVKANDIIVHLVEDIEQVKYFVGYSLAAEDVHQEGSDNVVSLINFSRFDVPVEYTSFANKHKRIILRGIVANKKPHYLPFQKRPGGGFRIPQGYYFGVALAALEKLVDLQNDARKSRLNSKKKQRRAKGNDRGPSVGGVKKEIVWEARQYELVMDLEAFLQRLGWKEVGSIWRPDVLMEKLGKTVLIEVKPDAKMYSMITAVGQVICYRSSLAGDGNIVCVIASKGKPADELLQVMKKYQIEFLDLGGAWQQELDAFLQESN